jgi:site-specific DNA-methyltransferase (cytosine-N4-specific)
VSAIENEFGPAEELPNIDYLRDWFPPSVLSQLVVCRKLIRDQVPRELTKVFMLMLSDILRKVSWQEPADLRIRRRKEPSANYPAVSEFLKSAQQKVQTIAAARHQLEGFEQTKQIATNGDVRNQDIFCQIGYKDAAGGLDAVVTSPPYATALPYIDTQRLSIAFLGLRPAGELRRLEAALTGSRQLRKSERKLLNNRIMLNEGLLPIDVAEFCCTLLEAVDPSEDGFRRQNKPALIYRYFEDMQMSLRNIAGTLRIGGTAMLVVGTNSTQLGGQDFIIDTPGLLAKIAEEVGLAVTAFIPLDTYARYGLHSKNSIREEALIVCEKRK